MPDDRALAAEVLRGTPLFADFDNHDLWTFVELADPLRFIAGTLVVRQGQSGDCSYIIIAGQAQVRHRRHEQTFELAVLGPGEFFGELALLDEGPRTADVLARTDCLMLRVSQTSLAALGTFHPAVAYKFVHAMGRVVVGRIRRTNSRYIDSLLVLGRRRIVIND